MAALSTLQDLEAFWRIDTLLHSLLVQSLTSRGPGGCTMAEWVARQPRTWWRHGIALSAPLVFIVLLYLKHTMDSADLEAMEESTIFLVGANDVNSRTLHLYSNDFFERCPSVHQPQYFEVRMHRVRHHDLRDAPPQAASSRSEGVERDGGGPRRSSILGSLWCRTLRRSSPRHVWIPPRGRDGDLLALPRTSPSPRAPPQPASPSSMASAPMGGGEGKDQGWGGGGGAQEDPCQHSHGRSSTRTEQFETHKKKTKAHCPPILSPSPCPAFPLPAGLHADDQGNPWLERQLHQQPQCRQPGEGLAALQHADVHQQRRPCVHICRVRGGAMERGVVWPGRDCSSGEFLSVSTGSYSQGCIPQGAIEGNQKVRLTPPIELQTLQTSSAPSPIQSYPSLMLPTSFLVSLRS